MLRRMATLVLPIVMVFIVVGVARGDAPWQTIISTPVLFLGALILGDNVRRRRSGLPSSPNGPSAPSSARELGGQPARAATSARASPASCTTWSPTR